MATVTVKPPVVKTPISGHVNYTPAQQVMFAAMIDAVRKVYEKNGFNAFPLRPVETMEDIMRKGGATAKQTYGIVRNNPMPGDDGISRLALPFDHTVPFAIWLADHLTEIHGIFKRYAIGQVHRGEHAEPGRFRGFWQLDVDIAGRKLTPINDVQCVMTMMKALEAIGIQNFTIYINHLTFAKALLAEFGLRKENFVKGLDIIDGLEKHPLNEVIQELLTLQPNLDRDKLNAVLALCKKKMTLGEIDQALDLNIQWAPETVTALQEMKQLFASFESAGANREKIGFCPGMVRGLDYYTGIVFETFLNQYPQFGSIASGGRFDDLVGVFNSQGADIQAVGGSIGPTRLFDRLLREGIIKPTREVTSDVIVLYQKLDLQNTALTVQNVAQRSFPTDIYTGNGDLREQLSFASTKGFPFAIIVSYNKNNEIQYALKDLTLRTQGVFHQEITEVVAELQSTYDPQRHGILNFTI